MALLETNVLQFFSHSVPQTNQPMKIKKNEKAQNNSSVLNYLLTYMDKHKHNIYAFH